MKLYLQILSQIQKADVARLLLLPAELQSGPVCQIRMSGGGRVWTRNFPSVETAVVDIQNAKLNEFEVSYSIADSNRFRLPGNPLSIVGLFTVSPTCDLWFKADDWPSGGERTMRMRKMNAKAAETALRYYGVSQKPSIFEVVVEMQATEPNDKILDACAEWLAEYIPKALDSLAVFGCADTGGREFFVKLESNVLMTEHIRIMAKLLPSAYPELGERFDTLHPVMFGSKVVCDAVGSALDKDARVIPSAAISDFAVVRLCVPTEVAATNPRVLPWIFLRDESIIPRF